MNRLAIGWGLFILGVFVGQLPVMYAELVHVAATAAVR